MAQAKVMRTMVTVTATLRFHDLCDSDTRTVEQAVRDWVARMYVGATIVKLETNAPCTICGKERNAHYDMVYCYGTPVGDDNASYTPRKEQTLC